MPETFCLFAQKSRALETSCLLSMHYFSAPWELTTKMDIVEDSALNGEDQGNHKSQIRGKLYAPPYCEHQRCNWNHYHGDEGWGQRRTYSLNDLKLCQTSGKSLYFPSQEKLPLSWVQTFPPPPPSRHLRIRLVRPSLTFLGHQTLLVWQDWLVFTAVFSVTLIYLENATTPPPWVKNFPPDWDP